MTIKYRDIQLKQSDKFNEKLDKRFPVRAVIVDSQGNDSGAGDIWADRNARRVWIREVGTASPSQVPCYNIRPTIGLGVLVGYELYSNVRQVLRSDTDFLGPTNPTGTSYESPDQDDFRPGGRLQLWLASKLIEPLATYPNTTGLMVNVVSGYYPYDSVRTFFAGQTNIDLSASQPAGPNEHRLVGLYLDSGNALQTVDGTAVSTAIDAPEPTWPDGAFQLSVVLLDDTQTSIGFSIDTDPDNDVFDRRMVWADINSFNSWPFDDIFTISSSNTYADFTSIAAAIASGLVGTRDGLVLDAESFSSTTSTTLSVLTMTLSGGLGQPEVTSSVSNDFTLSITNVGNVLRYLQVAHTAAGALSGSIKSNQDGSFYDHLRTVKTTGAATTSVGIWIYGGNSSGHIIQDCDISVAAGTTKYGILIDTAACNVVIEGGQISAATADIRVNHASANVTLKGPQLKSGGLSVAAGTVKGWYFDSNGNQIFVNGSGQSGGVWLQDASTELKTHYQSTSLGAALSAALVAAATGDIIKLEAGTYTLSSGETVSTSGISIVADSPGGVTVTNATASSQTFNVTGDNVTFRNFTVTQTGTGGGPTSVIAFSGNNFTLDNCPLTKTGAATLATGLYQYGGTGAKVFNPNITTSGGTTNYGFYNTIATGAIEFYGGKISGSTRDIFGDITTSTLDTYGTILEHGTVSYDGIYPRPNVLPVPTPPILINGTAIIAQRGTSFATAADGTYPVDRVGYFKSGTMVHTLSQSTSVPTIAVSGYQFPYSIKADCTTADGTIAAGDYTFFRYIIEGYDWLKISQQQWTIPFWVYGTKTGTHCFAVSNSGSDRSYVAEYTINTTNTWEFKTITVPASPSAGTWDYTNGIGARLIWTLAGGSTFQTTAGSWQTGNYFSTSNQVNACDSTSNDFQLIIGDPVPGPYARPMIPNPFGTYQALRSACLRYAYTLDASLNSVNVGQGAKTATTTINILFQHPVPMRTTPALTHNITGYTGGAPGTTTIAIVDYAANAFYTITGALTVALSNANTTYTSILFTAGTSWNGTAGDLSAMRIGPSVVATLAPSDYS